MDVAAILLLVKSLLDHRGLVLKFPAGALAHLGLARAYVLAGDKPVGLMASQRLRCGAFFTICPEDPTLFVVTFRLCEDLCAGKPRP